MKDKWTRYEYRLKRTRAKVQRQSGRPRLSIHRSLNHFYAQVIDDAEHKTLAYASTLSKEFKGKLNSGKNIAAAKSIGALIASKALAAGVKQVVFDRGAYRYHGRVKAIAEAARAGGLEF